MELEFTGSPSDFLAAAADHLAADPVLTTVVSSVTARAAAADARGAQRGDHPRWWALVREAGRVVGVAMRTAPFPPYPLFVLPMADEAALSVARTLHRRGEVVGGVNGALPTASVLAGEVARLGGGRVRVHQHTRLWEVAEVVPRAAPGRLRVATPADVALVSEWWDRFAVEAAGQSGRSAERGPGGMAEDVLQRLVEGLVHLWEVDGEAVHLTAHQAPAYGVVRLGPVYTPPEHRARGYAGAAVARVSQRHRAAGHRVCLYTDRANPASNKVYARIGYRPVVDMANLLVS